MNRINLNQQQATYCRKWAELRVSTFVMQFDFGAKYGMTFSNTLSSSIRQTVLSNYRMTDAQNIDYKYD